VRRLPNMRLKLSGLSLKGIGAVVRWRARTIVQRQCALRAWRPQLKRDPLGRRYIS
jgi:hypothetical protein